MIPTLLTVAILSMGMLLPYLPGRYDASAATLSFLIQVAAYASLLLAPVGLVWMLWPRRAKLWHRLAWVLLGLVVFVTAVAAVAMNQLVLGVLLALGALALLPDLRRRSLAALDRGAGARQPLPVWLSLGPLFLVTFMSTAVPRAAAWSRDRAIRHAAPLIAEIEAFRQRRGQYPISLQSLNHDVSTGVVGIERFHYEPNGDAYNVFFIRRATALDAQEVVMFNRRDEHRFTSHELDILQYDGAQLDLRRGDRRRTVLAQPHWVSILFD